MERASGILMHITSLPSPYGIGTLGKEAKRFIDFLAEAGQSYWQILPIGPTGYGDSPYQSYSTFAGNPYLIDLDLLRKEGLLKKEEISSVKWGDDPQQVDFTCMEQQKIKLLRRAAKRFDFTSDDFRSFVQKQADWLSDYSLYMALKQHFDQKTWMEWEEDIKLRKPDALNCYRILLQEEIAFWNFLQYIFFKQWKKIKRYAKRNQIKIIGDIPIYVALDSADVWANRELFCLDENAAPIDVSGCPPDAFSETGQLWGNPIYRWDYHKKTGYRWWMKRIRAAAKQYDIIRIDHFRGFDSYYAIPYGSETAATGRWEKGPGYDFFKTLKKKLGDIPIIAEDLGYLTPSVRKLLAKTGYPGMKVLEFAFDSREESDYLPHNYPHNCVVYTGTHDNNTLVGWLKEIPKEDLDMCINYLRLTKEEGYDKGIIKAAWASVGDTAIAQMQDFLGLNADARMNTPSTVGTNWKWRMLPGAATSELAGQIRSMTKLYGRLAKK